MAKDNQPFYSATAFYDELDPEEVEHAQRRMQTYPPEALRAGLVVDKIIVVHDAFKAAFEALDRMFQLSREYSMPQGGILVGPPGSGRRTVCQLFEERLPRSDLFAAGFGCIRIPVGGALPTVAAVVARLLRRYGYPFATGRQSQMELRREIVAEQILSKGTRLLVVTNAQSMLAVHSARPSRAGRALVAHERTLEFLCELQDATRVGLLLCGDARLDVLREGSPELASRLSVRIELSNFTEADKQWAGLLKRFHDELRRASDFDFQIDAANIPQLKKFHKASGGNARNLKRLLTEAVLIAASEKRRPVNQSDFARAYAAIRGPAYRETNPFEAGHLPPDSDKQPASEIPKSGKGGPS